MVKGKKKNFVKFDDDSAKRAAQKKQEGGAASDKTTAQQVSTQSQVARKPLRPSRNQHSFDNTMANDSAESMSHLSLQDADFPVATNSTHGSNSAHSTFSPPLAAPDTPLPMPSWKSVVKGESKGTHRKEKSPKVETQTNLETLSKGSSLPNEHPKDTSEGAPHMVPTIKPEPTTDNWVSGPTGPPVSTPKPFGAGLDHPLTVNVPVEPLTVNVPSVSGSTTEMSVHTPLSASATLNVDAPVFQPKSAQTITEFAPPPQVDPPASAPEHIEYVPYEEGTSHQQGYPEQIYQTEVQVPNAMVQSPEYYPNIASVISQPMIPFLPEMTYAGYSVVPVQNSDVHHIPTEMAPPYGPMLPDMQNSTTAWTQQPMYHDDQMDPNRDPTRGGHRTVYPPGMANRGYPPHYQPRYDAGRRNSGQPRHPAAPAYVRRDSRDSEASDSLNHQRGPSRQSNDRNYNKSNTRPPKNDLPRPDYRSSNNNHNKNRDQNQQRPSEGIDNQEKVHPSPDVDDWDSPPGGAEEAIQGAQQQNHQGIVENNYERHHPADTHYNATHSNDSSFNNSRISPNWRDRGPGRSNPKDHRTGDKGRIKREDGRKPGTLDGWLDRSEKDEAFNHWISHWQDYQKFTNVEEMTGDLFQMPKENSLAHCVAEDMRMGSGIAVTFKRDFKKQDELLNQRAKPGGLALIPHEGRFIYYLVTKKHSTGKPSYYTLWCSLQKMRDHIGKNNVEKLAMPRIGCGLDKLEWTMVKSMIQHIFEEVKVHITVCNFQQNEDQQASSLPSPKQYFSCKTVNVSYPICDIEQGTIIVFLSTETGQVSKEMQELDNKFHFLTKFREAQKKQGELFIYEDFQKNYVLCGCIVRQSPKDKLDFTSLAKCVLAINRYNQKLKTGDNYIYVGFQNVTEKDYQEDNLNNRIITILINYLRKVDVYICEDKREE